MSTNTVIRNVSRRKRGEKILYFFLPQVIAAILFYLSLSLSLSRTHTQTHLFSPKDLALYPEDGGSRFLQIPTSFLLADYIPSYFRGQ
jgi:hypothetical protein